MPASSALAAEFQVAVIGGDTNSWDGPLVICSTVLGSPTARGPVRRNGAQAGDWIMVTGDLGGSILGKHLAFRPRILEAFELHKAVDLHAMIDISDGLAADLHHLLDESGVGATIRAANLPISEAALRIDDLRSPVEHALGDGEDFELLFTVSPEDGGRLCATRRATSDCRTSARLRPTPRALSSRSTAIVFLWRRRAGSIRSAMTQSENRLSEAASHTWRACKRHGASRFAR